MNPKTRSIKNDEVITEITSSGKRSGQESFYPKKKQEELLNQNTTSTNTGLSPSVQD